MLRKGRHHYSQATHCKRGHAFSVDNTSLLGRNGTYYRKCRECDRIRARIRWAAKAATTNQRVTTCVQEIEQ